MKRFSDLQLEARRELFAKIDRKTVQVYIIRDGERYALDALDVALIAEDWHRALAALACREGR